MTTEMAQEAEPRSASDAANISRLSSDGNDGRAEPDVVQLDVVSKLVERAQRGDTDAFGELYRIHRPAIYRLARFYVHEAAEDAVAETFVRAWAALPRYRDTGAPFSAWLYGIARHVAVDEVRRRQRSEPRSELPDRGVHDMIDDRLTLGEALLKLPTAQRQVIELKFLLGMTNPEVAAAMGTTTGAVNAKQWRALAALREVLEGS